MSNWDHLKKFTSARVGLGRAGHAQPTKMILEFQRAHAEARNAVLQSWDYSEILTQLPEALVVASQAKHREDYLKFPNKGRALNADSRTLLTQAASKKTASITASASNPSAFNPTSNPTNESDTVVFIVSDGLSANAIRQHFLKLWDHFSKTFQINFPELRTKIVVVPFGRVAISDEIGEIFKAKMSVIFIGERPGLNSSDSLGIYMTYHPKTGNSDAQRNCISNVRPPEGLSYEAASLKLNYLIQESLRRQLSGVQLKDECFIDQGNFSGQLQKLT
jgi:ethanolamine ammonia-lyase small subunit